MQAGRDDATMTATTRDGLRKVLGFAAIVEVTTGLLLILDPALVVALLLGVNAASLDVLLGRFLGIALLALGVAYLPVGRRAGYGAWAIQGMLTYNVLVALFLAYVGIGGHFGGPLLWPAVVLHAAVTLILVWAWRSG
jgi:hypothetical protein